MGHFLYFVGLQREPVSQHIYIADGVPFNLKIKRDLPVS